MDVLSQLVRAAAGGRARGGSPPRPARMRELARAVQSGEYQVPPDKLAAALLRALGESSGPRR